MSQYHRSSRASHVLELPFIHPGLCPRCFVHPSLTLSAVLRSSERDCVRFGPFIPESLCPLNSVHPFIVVSSSYRSSEENLKARCQQRHLLYERLLTPCLQAFFPVPSHAKGLRVDTLRLCRPEVDFYALGIGVCLYRCSPELMVGGLCVSRDQSDPRGPPSAVAGSLGYLRLGKKWAFAFAPEAASLLGTGSPATCAARPSWLLRWMNTLLRSPNFTPRGEVEQGGGRKAASLFHHSFPTIDGITASCLVAQAASETS